MKELKGSEKQRKWADEIRNNFIEKIAGLSEAQVREISEYGEDVDYDIFKKMGELALSQDDASVWITLYGYSDFSAADVADDFIMFAENTDEEDWDVFYKTWDLKKQ